MSSGDPASPRKASLREISEKAVGGSKANPDDVQGQLAASRERRRLEKQEKRRIERLQAQTTDSNQ